MVYSDPTVDRIEASFKDLADDVNKTSASTRNGWVFFLALQAYFFIALAGITHRDLLLDTPIPLPLLQVPIALQGFFLFGPVILVLIHMGILLQHVMLARQAREFHNRVANFEGRGLFRNHGVRVHLHPYVFTQLIAGPQRSAFFAFFLALLSWLSLGILPVILLLDFQTTFLPYHDLRVIWAQRGFLILDIVMLTVFAVFIRYPALKFTAGFGRTIVERPVSVLISLFLAGGAMFFSLSVATIPGERMDRAMSSVWPVDIADARKDRGQTRQAFWLTALLFEGAVDQLSGQPASTFGRNLVVTDADLVKDKAFDEGETSLNLRLRDLRYGIFDRTDLHQADFTGANLTQASLRETNLVEVKAEKANLRGADLWRAQMFPSTSPGRPVTGIILRDADLRGANLSQANLQGAILEGALLEGADFRGAKMDAEAAAEANRQGGKF
jgi:hypothetical protein